MRSAVVATRAAWSTRRRRRSTRSADARPRVGYLVPQFPGQTHAMFWREIEELRAIGLHPVLLTTRSPDAGPADHEWAGRALGETLCLADLGALDAARALARVLRRGRVVAGLVRRDATTPRDAIALVAAVLVGSHLTEVAGRLGVVHIHVHSCGRAADVVRAAHALGGPSYSLTLHGPLADYGGHQRQKWSTARFGIVITQALLACLRDEIGPDLPEVLAVSGMTVPAGRFERATPYAPYRDSGDEFRVFCCARLNPAKGLDVLINAVAHLVGEGRRVHLVIAGEDDEGGSGYRRHLEQVISRTEMSGRVELLGSISEMEVAAQLHRAHVFALASHAEPLGVVILEALAAGVPIVATNAGGIPTIVDDGRSALLVPPRDSSALAAALGRVMDDPELAVHLAQGASAASARRAALPSSASVLAGLLRETGAVA